MSVLIYSVPFKKKKLERVCKHTYVLHTVTSFQIILDASGVQKIQNIINLYKSPNLYFTMFWAKNLSLQLTDNKIRLQYKRQERTYTSTILINNSFYIGEQKIQKFSLQEYIVFYKLSIFFGSGVNAYIHNLGKLLPSRQFTHMHFRNVIISQYKCCQFK